MRFLIYFALVVIGIAILGFIASVIFVCLDEEQRQDDQFNREHAMLCERAKAAKACPHACHKCAWGMRKKRGKIVRAEGNCYESIETSSPS